MLEVLNAKRPTSRIGIAARMVFQHGSPRLRASSFATTFFRRVGISGTSHDDGRRGISVAEVGEANAAYAGPFDRAWKTRAAAPVPTYRLGVYGTQPRWWIHGAPGGPRVAWRYGHGPYAALPTRRPDAALAAAAGAGNLDRVRPKFGRFLPSHAIARNSPSRNR